MKLFFFKFTRVSRKLCVSLLLPVIVCAQTPSIDSIRIENGQVVFEMNGPAGEYIIQGSEDLESEGWTQLCRHGSDGSALNFYEPIDPEVTSMFFRLVVIAASDGFHLTGAFAEELDDPSIFDDLSTTFGLNFLLGDAVLPAISDLSSADRNARMYAATVAALSKLAQDVRDSFPLESQPSAIEVVAALTADISDGSLDGLDGSSSITIGSTGVNLPNFDDAVFFASVADVKSAMTGLYNVEFTSDGDASYSVAAPATWCDFYWDSADWQ